MRSSPSAADALLRQLCRALDLPFEPQDWGLVNADHRRFGEFCDYYLRMRHDLEPSQRFELAGLIVASANERLLAGDGVDLDALLTLAGGDSAAFALHLDYWSGLGHDPDFPLAQLLRQRHGTS